MKLSYLIEFILGFPSDVRFFSESEIFRGRCTSLLKYKRSDLPLVFQHCTTKVLKVDLPLVAQDPETPILCRRSWKSIKTYIKKAQTNHKCHEQLLFKRKLQWWHRVEG